MLICGLAAGVSASAQQIRLDPVVLSSSGSQGTMSDGTLIMWTVGQPVYTTLQTSGVSLTQGFHQPGFLNCPGDLDNNGIINTTDLLIFITFFGTSNVNADLNGDGFVAVTDLIVFITLIGTGCN
jgi:hypothetical protein